MSNTLTFYSTAQPEVNALLNELLGDGAVKTGTNTEGTIEGSTPIGGVSARYDFSPSSGVLNLTVTHKPMLLTMSHIEGLVRGRLAEIKTRLAATVAPSAPNEAPPVV